MSWLFDILVPATTLSSGVTLVSIVVYPDTPTYATGSGPYQFTAIGTYSDTSTADITSLVTWAGSSAVGTTSAGGLFTPLTPGTIEVSATLGPIDDFSTVTVYAAAAQAAGTHRWVAAIEGYPTIFADGDLDAVETAWAGTDWEDATVPVLGGLMVEITCEQELDVFDPIRGGGTAKLWIQPDATDQFGKDVAKSQAGAQTYFTATSDREDLSLTVQSTAVFGSSGHAYAGNECFEYTSTTATQFTIPDLSYRGKFAPFGAQVGGDQDGQWAQHHRVGNVDYGVPLNPLITEQIRTWKGRWVGIWHHTNTAGVLDTKANADVAWAGKILEISDDSRTGFAAVQIEHVLDVVRNSTLMRDPFKARLAEGVYIRENQEFNFTDSILGVESDANPLVGTVGASGANQIEPGYYTADQILSVWNDWLASELAAARIDGSYTWAMRAPTSTDDVWRAVCDWSVNGGPGELVGWRIHMPLAVATFMGLLEQGDQGGGTPSGWALGWQIGTADVPYDFSSAEEPWRILVRLGGTGSDWYVPIETPSGTFINQETLLPGAAAGGPVVFPNEPWGIFKFDGVDSIMVASPDDETTPTEFGHGFTFVFQTPNQADFVGRRYNDHADLEINQVLMLESTVKEIVKALFYSTGTLGYNDPDWDAFEGNGLGIAIPADLLGSTFDNSVDNLPGADSPILIVLDKPTKLHDVLKGDLFVRGAHLVFKDGHLKFVTWSTPTAADATVTLAESNKSEPAQNAAPDHRAVSLLSSQWARPIIKLEYNRSIFDGRYRDTFTIEDRTAVDDLGGAGDVMTFPLPNVYSETVQAGAGIQEIAPGLAERMALITRPLRFLTRSMDMSLWWSVTPGDIAIVTDDFARDPSTGARGITSRPAMVVKTSWNPGGPVPGGNGVAPMSGEVTVVFLDIDRIAPYSPCAEVDETSGGNGGYNGGTKVLTCKAHAHSESSAVADATRFEVGDKITVIEVCPADPTAPTSWNDTVAGQTGNTITLTTGLAGYDTSGATIYRVISQTYSDAVATQQTDVYQADDADGRIEDSGNPYLYGATSPASAFTTEAHTALPEFHSTTAYGDGKPRDTGYERGFTRMIENLIDHKTAIQSPMLEATARSPSAASSTVYELHSITPIFLNATDFPHGMDRFLYVAPFFRSTDGTSTTLRVSLCSKPPVANSLTNVPMQGIYDQVSFTTSSTTFSIPADLGLDLRCKRGDGIAFLVIEYLDKCQTRGLAECIMRERE